MGVGDFKKRLNNKNLGPIDQTEEIQLRSEDTVILESISASGSNSVHTATFGSLPATGDYWVFGAIAGDPLFPHQQLGESPNARYGVRYEVDGDTTPLAPQPNDYNVVPVVVVLASTANAAAVASTTAVAIAVRTEIPVSVSATGAVLTLTFNRKGTASAPSNGVVRATDVVFAVSAAGEIPTREAIELRETNFDSALSDSALVAATSASTQNVGQFRPSGAGWFGDMDTFQVGGSVAGVAEVTSVIIPTASVFPDTAVDSAYWTLSAPSGDFYVWYQAGVSVDPSASGTGIEVTVSTIDTAASVATATQIAVDAVGAFGAAVSATNVTITNASTGAVTDAADSTAGVSASVNTQGVDEDSTDWTVTEVNKFPNPKFVKDTS